jgi:large subunit ribosomal protein L31
MPIFAVLNFKEIMKEGIHPKNYRVVVFKDMSNDHTFMCRSTVETRESIKWEDGKEYPLYKLEISNTSHPFFTGQTMFVDTAGRIDKFKKRYGKK